MEVILLENISNLGALGDKVDVKAGFGRNYLFPQGKAVPATEDANAGEEGKLFGSIGTRDIADAVTAAGVEIDKSEVRLPEGALRELGEYEIVIQVHGDVTGDIALAVVAE